MNEEVLEWLMSRDSSIFEEHLNGVSNVEIARKFNLSPNESVKLLAEKKIALGDQQKTLF
jgi:Mor family transcriptional regulator